MRSKNTTPFCLLLALFVLFAALILPASNWDRPTLVPVDVHSDIDWRDFGAVSPEELAMTAQALEDNCFMVVSHTEDIETPGHYALLARHIEGCVIAP